MCTASHQRTRFKGDSLPVTGRICQVKSSILLAGLYADGKTSVTEPALSRNHTEIMLRSFGATVTSEGTTASICGSGSSWTENRSAWRYLFCCVFYCAALIVPGSEILIKNCGINETRDGILRVCRAMGADITVLNAHTSGGEAVADLLVRYTPDLKGCVIEGDIIPTLIDEIPVIAV